MAKYKFFIGAMCSERYEDGDSCVMLVFPKNNTHSHEVIRPIMLEADTVREIKDKIQGELNMYFSTVYGFAPKPHSQGPQAAPAPVAMTPMVEVESLTISDPGPVAVSPEKQQMLLDLGGI